MTPSIYATCCVCGHVEPRPAHTLDDWIGCEACGAPTRDVKPYEDLTAAEDASAASLGEPT